MVSVSCKISYVLGHIHTLAWFLFIMRGFGRGYVFFLVGVGGMQKKESTDFRSLEAGISGVVMRTLPPLLFALLLWKKTFTDSY